MMSAQMNRSRALSAAKKFPPHISPDKLPTGITYESRGKGRWIYRKGSGRKHRGKEIRFGNAQSTIAEIWRFVENIESEGLGTFRAISNKFMKSNDWLALAPRTQKGYESLHKTICETKTRSGDKLGDVPLEVWTPGSVRRYMENRPSASSAAADVRYIKRVFSWAISMDYYMQANPAKGVMLKNMVKPRTHYVQDKDYCLAIALAPLDVGLAAHLSYLTNKRRTDILSLTRSQISPQGVEFVDSKTEKQSIVGWSDELRETIKMATETAGDTLLLFPRPGSPNERITDSAFNTAWQRLRARVKAAGGTPFQFKDIRAKHASDLESDDEATEQLMHSGKQVTRRHYRRRPKKLFSIR
jgi:integrase